MDSSTLVRYRDCFVVDQLQSLVLYFEMDAVVIFDQVQVPWERVFVLGDRAMCQKQFFETPCYALEEYQAVVRFMVKLRVQNPNDEPIPLAVALELVIRACSGLHYAHEREIIHRDIKLENILLDDNNQYMKLIDFGFSTCLPHE